MEIVKKGKFITDFYGSASAIGENAILQKWIDNKQTEWLASWTEKAAKKGENALQVLQDILSIFHRIENEVPIIGNWMFRRCLIVTGETIFNAIKDKTHPKRTLIPLGITLVEPISIQLFRNGKLIKKPDDVKTYTVTTKKASFFKAYEVIKAGAEFEVTVYADDEILKEEHINLLLNKAGSIGVGAFRERYGKFVFTN